MNEIDIEKIAKLAKLRLTDEEAEKAKTMLSLAENNFNLLPNPAQCEISSISKDIAFFREDVISDSLERDILLQNAPQTQDNAFVVPRII